MLKSKYQNIGIYLLLALSLYFVFFQHLDSFPIRNWDEAMFAVNACEMINNHNFIGLFFKNLPDLFNTKPPCQIWLQVLFIKFIGYNELAIRLPSALASSGSALLLFFFIKKRSSLLFALCVFFVFISSLGVATFHTGRSGDADALLSFFLLCYCISFYKWLFENKSISLFYFFLFLSLAFLTKSIAALFFAPALLIVTVYFKKTNLLLKNKWFYVGITLFLTTSIGYIFLRNIYNPGYIDILVNTDMGRYTTILDSHAEPFDFYLNRLYEERFKWIILVLPGALLLWANIKTRSAFIFLACLFVTYFLILSGSVSKVEWYDLPFYPILSIFCGYAIYTLVLKFNSYHIHAALLLAFIFLIPLYFTFRNSYKSEVKPSERKLEILNEYAFKNKNNHSLNGIIFLTEYFDRPLYFYKYRLNTKGEDFTLTNSIDNLKENSIVVVAEDSLKTALLKRYKTTTLDEYRTVLKVKI
ncbi:MAG TPA: glycosyltransferase family 39 protein [Bacteroidia bacterium]|nr:glycosyltransferase family 39 protein [Bacteroidia bacterium]